MATVFKSQTAKKQRETNGQASDDKNQTIRNKQRILLLSSRGINYRHRHLMNDLEALLPHAKKDSKLDSKSKLGVLNELAELNNCNNCMFFEVRKRQDLYLWMSKTPNGPCAKFHVQNIHTMGELKMTGNCLKGSRPLLSFDKNFDTAPHWRLLKELFIHMFGVPKGARRSKPFIDHVLTFSIADNRIWFRNYQIVENKEVQREANSMDTTLIEIGPRFVMNVIRIFDGSFGGTTVFENPEFVSPNQVRRNIRQQKAVKYQARVVSIDQRGRKLVNSLLPPDPLDEKIVFDFTAYVINQHPFLSFVGLDQGKVKIITLSL